MAERKGKYRSIPHIEPHVDQRLSLPPSIRLSEGDRANNPRRAELVNELNKAKKAASLTTAEIMNLPKDRRGSASSERDYNRALAWATASLLNKRIP